MKKIKQTILYLVAFAVALFLLMVVVNLPVFDEELLPEVKAIKNIKAKTFSENNAYPAFIAFNGPSDKTLHQSTAEVRAFLNKKIKDTGLDYLSEEEYDQIIGKGHDLEWKQIYQTCNSRKNTSCMAEVIDLVQSKPVDHMRLKELLVRYQSLLEYTVYGDATQMNFDSPLIAYSPLTTVKRLFLANELFNQEPKQFIQIVQQDMQFWRMVLKDGHTLITQMIAVSTLRDSLGSLSVAIKRNHFAPAQLMKLSEQIDLLSSTEKDMSETFKLEFKYGMSMWEKALKVEQKSWTDLFKGFHLNATQNTSYTSITKPRGELSKLDSQSLYQKVNSGNGMLESPASWTPAMIYNPAGKSMIGYAIPAYSDYMGRIHDLDGMIRLLKLQIEIALNPNQKIEQVIQSSQYTNPYTNEPMNYNKGSNSIYFNCLHPHSSCETML